MKIKIVFLIIFLVIFIQKMYNKNADAVHQQAFVADTHNDVLMRSMMGRNILTELPESHSDLVKFKNGGVDLQVFSVWVSPSKIDPEEYYNYANAMITQLEYLCSRVPDQWAIPYNYQDIVYNDQHDILSCMIGVEGGHVIENDLSKLNALYDRGMRYLSLTWNNSTKWATSAKDETEKGDSLMLAGLTNFGQQVVRRCNDLGVIIDISHAGEQTFWDVLEITTKPIIASHSSVYTLCPHFRNLKDEQLLALEKNNGVVFVNFYPAYIDSTFSRKGKKIRQEFQPQLDSLASLYEPESNELWYAENALLEPSLSSVAPNLDDVIDHIDYIADLIGVDHVGLGADWDGVEVLPVGIENIAKLPSLTKKLIERGYSQRDIRKILGGNFKRVFKDVNHY
ncbi:MAG: dipeptidase [Candidatus Marinimicrobia bacterium]|jgi:membrane dipeptidase|nr:dipeptidase [Candidatus Neomarinimicrobiota bacterium]|tara:strand:+ start:1356 stop:2543 length:1188 start_codon:yes stop_codon:yes gene_type:complete